VNILYESAGILILALSSWVMSAKDKLRLEKLRLRTRDTEQADH
jgi:hypothetical protein